jgi:uncharacterized lipoprotein
MTKPSPLRLSLALALAAGVAGVAGCSDVNKADEARVASASLNNPNFQRFDTNLPPKQLLAVARQVLAGPPYNLPIESEAKGVLTTGWKEYRGAFHIVRYWQERTRYQVAVYPDFDDPTGKSSLRVVQETQTRASDQGHWFALLDEDRSDRAADLAKAIVQAANQQAPTK